MKCTRLYQNAVGWPEAKIKTPQPWKKRMLIHWRESGSIGKSPPSDLQICLLACKSLGPRGGIFSNTSLPSSVYYYNIHSISRTCLTQEFGLVSVPLLTCKSPPQQHFEGQAASYWDRRRALQAKEPWKGPEQNLATNKMSFTRIVCSILHQKALWHSLTFNGFDIKP